MIMRKQVLVLVILLLGSLRIIGQEIGPAKGTLIIMGGGNVRDPFLKSVTATFGTLDVPMVVIPTAEGQATYDENFTDFVQLKNRGVTNVQILHTTEPEVANTEAFTEPLRHAKVVWFSGGRQWRLVDAYKNTLTEKMLWDVLSRGGIIGGSSAGATIQGSYLVRGDTRNNQIMMGDHQQGFGFLKNVAIDQHVLARNRHFDLLEVLAAHPGLLGIGIDEKTGIVVKGDKFEVIGDSYVAVYDGSFWSREGIALKNLPANQPLFYFLRPGDTYDLKNRKVVD